MNSVCTRGKCSFTELFKEKEATVLQEHHIGQTRAVDRGGRSEQRGKSLDWRKCRRQYVPEGWELSPYPARSPFVREQTLGAGVAAALVAVTRGAPRSSSRGAAGLGSGRLCQPGGG